MQQVSQNPKSKIAGGTLSTGIILPFQLDHNSSMNIREDSLTISIGGRSQPEILDELKEDEPQINSGVREYTDYSSLASIQYKKCSINRDIRTPNAYGSARKTVIELQSFYNRNSNTINVKKSPRKNYDAKPVSSDVENMNIGEKLLKL